MLLSYCDILINKECKIKALNVILSKSLRYCSLKLNECGDIIIQVYSWRIKTFEKSFRENNISFCIQREYGLLSRITKNKHRVGLLIGFFILILVTWYSQNVIWRIDVKGNSSIDSEAVITALEKEGIYLGRYIPTIDYDILHNRFLMNNADFSWISVNISGNIATVNIRETAKHIVDKSDNSYTNIIASQDGQIALISVIDGEKQISIGETVKKGDLLISGIIDSKSEGVRLTEAKGEVFAFVNKKISIKAPLKSSEKVYTGEVEKEKTLIFYKNYINLFKKHNNYEGFYDTIEETRQISLFGKIKLPIRVKVLRHYKYEIVDVEYSRNQAVDLAFMELRSNLDSALENSELLSKEIKINYDEENVYLECNVYCLEDIAEEKKFYID